MKNYVDIILESIKEKNPLHYKKMYAEISGADDQFSKRANQFFSKYDDFLNSQGKDFEFAIESYLRMISDMQIETMDFFRSGKYNSTSFEDVKKRVYHNPDIMEYYMNGLMLSQFVWKHHYDLQFDFQNSVRDSKDEITNYLEVGSGHGLFAANAKEVLGDNANYDILDISSVSLEMTKALIGENEANYILSDIFDYEPDISYDFITLGEVLEHVEDPDKLLLKLKSLLSENGRIYITVPTNAPAIDHIFLFKNSNEIRDLIKSVGLKIVVDNEFVSERVELEREEELCVATIYTSLIKKA